MRQVFEHHGFVEDSRGRVDDPAQRGALHAELGENLMHLAVECDLRILFGHDQAVHRFGHLDEADLLVQHHQCEVELLSDTARACR